jgi:hypothetical protein
MEKNVVSRRSIYKIIYFALWGLMLIFLSCEDNKLVDPFWDIDLNSEISTINESLYSRSAKGSIVDCVFSFEQEFYIKRRELDVKVSTSLDHPKRVDRYTKIDYTLVTEFKDDFNQKFNPQFYSYFKSRMSLAYGSVSDEKSDPNTIHLNWKKDSDIIIQVKIIKDINLYMVSIKKRI